MGTAMASSDSSQLDVLAVAGQLGVDAEQGLSPSDAHARFEQRAIYSNPQ
jgi:hypothetical protein